MYYAYIHIYIYISLYIFHRDTNILCRYIVHACVICVYIYIFMYMCIYICMYVCFMCINILLSIYTYTVHTMIKHCRTQQDELQQNLLKVHPDRNLQKKLPQISIDF